jgi:hypothetical protein
MTEPGSAIYARYHERARWSAANAKRGNIAVLNSAAANCSDFLRETSKFDICSAPQRVRLSSRCSQRKI